MKKNITKTIILILIAVGIFFIDQYSKYLIDKNLGLNESITVIENFFKLTYVRNTGAAFSILSGKVNLIILISWIILFYLIYEIYLYFKVPYLSYFLSVLIGGLSGNLYDRVILGYVRDFLDFKILKYNFAIINISDIFIVSGTVLVILLLLIKGDKYENDSKRRTVK